MCMLGVNTYIICISAHYRCIFVSLQFVGMDIDLWDKYSNYLKLH